MLGTMGVPVKLPYLKKDELYDLEKPYTTDFAVDHIPGAAFSNHRFDYENLCIADAKDDGTRFNLENNGFCFIKAKTSVSPNLADDDQYVKDVYFAEVEKVLHQTLPGYERIDYLDHLVSVQYKLGMVPITDETGSQTGCLIPRETRGGD